MISDVKILIVDDGSLSSLQVLTGLKSQGFNYIELAINSNCMFDYLDRGHFGLIISNWSRMEMPGKEFINTVRKQPKYKHIPVIMLTHPTVTMNFQDGLRDDDVRFVNKPLDFKVMSDTIHEVLEGKEILK
jgi:two-component system, chemotaxis family, chemotaxis protein CheY